MNKYKLKDYKKPNIVPTLLISTEDILMWLQNVYGLSYPQAEAIVFSKSDDGSGYICEGGTEEQWEEDFLGDYPEFKKGVKYEQDH